MRLHLSGCQSHRLKESQKPHLAYLPPKRINNWQCRNRLSYIPFVALGKSILAFNRPRGKIRSMEPSAEPSENDDEEKSERVFLSAVLTLVLSILGSSVLSIPYAWSRLGVLCGLITQIVVAICNAIASVLLLRTAAKVGKSTYEDVAEAVGGPVWKILTQVSLFILLFGTIVGDFALLGDVGNRAVHSLWEQPPAFFDQEGRLAMVLLVILILPLCLLKRMRSLELAGTAGLVVIVAVMVIIIFQSIHTGMPAIRNGEMPLWSVQVTKDLPEAMAVMGFAFYVAPMLLPLRAEMPSGKKGDSLAIQATVLVVIVISQVIYGCLGIFGAARHGLATSGNVLSNEWLPIRAQGVLDAVMALYLGISIPPISLSLRCTLDGLLAGVGNPHSPVRWGLETIAPIIAALGIALTCPQASEKVFAITGATGVMLICYLIPVVLHLMARSQALRSISKPSDLTEALVNQQDGVGDREDRPQGPQAVETVTEVVVPILVGVIGVGISVAALAISILSVIY